MATNFAPWDAATTARQVAAAWARPWGVTSGMVRAPAVSLPSRAAINSAWMDGLW